MENLRDKMDRVAQTRRQENELSDKNFEDVSKKRLVSILEKKVQTSFIGALSQFENLFSHLWGYNKDERDLTDEQFDMREMWEEVRTNILNNGNNQIRAIQNEINQYTIKWNRYRLDMKKGD